MEPRYLKLVPVQAMSGILITSLEHFIDSLATPLKTSDGGTGLTTFAAQGVFYASNTSAVAQATGSNGQVMQITNSVPTFDDLDGGTF